jgi:hypothetical protein|tara:strand:- start:8195 stop:8584 length:390 start_codon:yes stop_codon:yes gene_type:complete
MPAGDVTITSSRVGYGTVSHGSIVRLDCAIETDGSEDATGVSAVLAGKLLGAVYVYGTLAATTDIVVNNSDGIDLLGGNGANLAQANALIAPAWTSFGVPFTGPLTVTVDEGGATATGTLRLYIERMPD